MSDYPPNMTLRPLTWAGRQTGVRRRAPFRSTWSDTMELLRRELRHLSTSGRSYPDTVLQIALREQDFRLDGLPRASAVPSMPGVILHIEAKVGALSYPCDTFDRWQDNLRAIALGLEALRKVGRYGITPGNEQYTGWKALPASSGLGFSFSSDEAVKFLRGVVEDTGEGLDLGTPTQLYRRAKAAAHPDRNDGDRKKWDVVEHCGDVLRAAGAL